MNFLPGWDAPFLAGVDKLSTISMFATTSNTGSTTINLPAGINAGDLIIVDNCAGNASGTIPTSVLPAGFTLIDTQSIQQGASYSARSDLYYKIAVGGEAGATITGMVGTADQAFSVAVVRGNAPIVGATVQAVTGVSDAGTGSPPLVTLPSGSSPSPTVVLAAYLADATGLGAITFTPGSPTILNPSIKSNMYVQLYSNSPVNTDIDLGNNGGASHAEGMQGCYIDLT